MKAQENFLLLNSHALSPELSGLVIFTCSSSLKTHSYCANVLLLNLNCLQILSG